MKILYCLAGTYNSGGMERIVTDKANWLSENGFEVFIVTTEQKERNNFFKLNDCVKRIDLDIMYSETNTLNPISKYFKRSSRLRLHKKKLQNLVKEIQPDIIISTFGNEVGLVPKLKTNAKIIAEIHFSRWYRIQLNRRGIWKWIDRYLTIKDKQVLSKYDKFVSLTREDLDNWGHQDNLIVIPNFINKISPTPAKLKSKTMTAVGRLSYQKGYDRLIKAWKIVSLQHQDWKLEIYGAGEELKTLLELITSLDLGDNITIHRPTSDIDAVYQNTSALLLSSRYEGLPMVLLEAISNGLPVIAYKCQCGPKDVILSEIDGLLIEEGDVEGLASAILRLIEDKDLRIQIGFNAYKKSSYYLKDNIMPLWLQLFSSIKN